MFLYITKTGTAFKVSTYSSSEPLQPWTHNHPKYKLGCRSASSLLTQMGTAYAEYELEHLRKRYYTELTPFERGVLNECEHYAWCAKNNEKYYSPV